VEVETRDIEAQACSDVLLRQLEGGNMTIATQAGERMLATIGHSQASSVFLLGDVTLQSVKSPTLSVNSQAGVLQASSLQVRHRPKDASYSPFKTTCDSG
jgi:hypothetical protein